MTQSFRAMSWCAALLFPCAVSGQAPDLGRVERLVVDGTNELRRGEGLGAVAGDAALGRAARALAEYMARTDNYGHEADGKKPSERARSHGYDYCLVSENIAYQFSSAGFKTAELAGTYVAGWKASPGHRKNMLEGAATDTAVAVARSSRTGRYYAVQMFGRPRSASVEFRVENHAAAAVRYRVGDATFALAPGVVRTHRECSPQEVTLVSSRQRDTSVRPANGQRLVVVGEAGRATFAHQPRGSIR